MNVSVPTPGAPEAPAPHHPAAPDTPSGHGRPDAARWPGVATVPRCSPPRSLIGRALLTRALDRLPLHVRWGDGTGAPGTRRLGTGGPNLRVRDTDAFVRRVAVGGLIGFGESHMAREWEADDLPAVLGVLARHVTELVPAPLHRVRRLWDLRRPASERNTVEAARDNVQRHYDLSNDLFALFLDETLTYSGAVFRSLPAAFDALPAAQHRKIDRLLDLARVGSGTRLLEIGTGWGELALRAAARGARVTTVTLSAEQRDLALTRVAHAGYADRVDVRLSDYRDVRGDYDAIVSVEMIEAVGAEFWPEFFGVLDRRLAPGGRIALQAITMPHERMLATRSAYTWIQKYIFPGGMIPSLRAVDDLTRTRTTLRVTRDDPYGPHYAETLRLWRARFADRAAEVDALGFDPVFRRMWDFYLAYSEAGFATGYLNVRQILLERAAPGVPAPRTEGSPA
ncbi:class I SAM-dependent methyltransferase [Streptomyces diastaticus]|uniref:class I SAM-dependent methyltransferase n=1 Tax=Streptomyces diastaticus TaxID=1956 RepID=UPI00382C7AAC